MFNRRILRRTQRPSMRARSAALSPRVDRPPDITERIDLENREYVDGGAHGDVYRCTYNSPSGPVLVAVKTLRCFKGKETIEKDMHRETGIWRRLNHAHVVPFLGIAQGFGIGGSAGLVSLWMSKGTLHTFLQENAVTLTLEDRLKILQGVASGLTYLHSFPIIHGDLTSYNVLMDEGNTARLVDFGLASAVGRLQTGMSYLQRMTRNPGAIRFAAPELVLVDDTPAESESSDVYSFGCVMLEVLTGVIPWAEAGSEQQVMYWMMKGKTPGRPTCGELGDYHWVFIGRCWSRPDMRPTAKEVEDAIVCFLSSDGAAVICATSGPWKALMIGSITGTSVRTTDANGTEFGNYQFLVPPTSLVMDSTIEGEAHPNPQP